jgi:hypothetical protein
MSIECNYCKRECKNKNSQINHERFCKENPNKKDSPFKLYKKLNPAPWNKGKVGVQVSPAKGKPGTMKNKKHTEETKRIMSNKAKERYLNGWEPVAGRCKKYSYNSPVAGDIKVDGTWELTFCQYADKKGLRWRRNKDRFAYVKPDGTNSTYCPDFFVEDWNSYIEVKGYETDLDKAKWEQFPNNLTLIVYKKKDILEMKKFI